MLGGLMGGRGGAGGAKWVEFVRVFNQVRLVARNAAHVAAAGTPQARAVKRGLLAQPAGKRGGAQPAASRAPHGAGRCLGAVPVRPDGRGRATAAQLPRGLCARCAPFRHHRGARHPELLALTVQQHFAAGALASAQPGTPAGAGPSVPATLPDPRSLFVQQHLSLTRLPAAPMRTRAADARIGHFVTSVSDFGDEFARSPKRFINRWRLEKKSPAAALSEPVRPIVYWIDRSVPERYREPIRAGSWSGTVPSRPSASRRRSS